MTPTIDPALFQPLVTEITTTVTSLIPHGISIMGVCVVVTFGFVFIKRIVRIAS